MKTPHMPHIHFRMLPDALSASDYQSLHSRATYTINQLYEEIRKTNLAASAAYEKADPDDQESAPYFLILNDLRVHSRALRKELKFLHRVNAYYKKMSRAAYP